MQTLRAAPFELPWGSEVFAKLVAKNAYGESPESDAGGGAIMVGVPDAPTQLKEDFSERGKTTLGLLWSDGASNGGLEIIDYKLSFKQNDDQPWQEVAKGVTERKYTVFDLQTGIYYLFKVESRNANGYSQASETL